MKEARVLSTDANSAQFALRGMVFHTASVQFALLTTIRFVALMELRTKTNAEFDWNPALQMSPSKSFTLDFAVSII